MDKELIERLAAYLDDKRSAIVDRNGHVGFDELVAAIRSFASTLPGAPDPGDPFGGKGVPPMSSGNYDPHAAQREQVRGIEKIRGQGFSGFWGDSSGNVI